MEVVKKYTVENANAEELSACVWELMKEDGGQIFHRSYDPMRKKWFVAAEFWTLFGGGNGIYNYSVSFEDIDMKNVSIEIRSLKTMWGNAQAPIEGIFINVDTCKKSLNLL